MGLIREFSGHIIEIDKDTLYASITDKQTNIDYDLSFPRSNIKKDQEKWLSLGIIFDMKIYDNPGKVEVDLMEPIPFTKEQLKEIKDRAKQWNKINWI